MNKVKLPPSGGLADGACVVTPCGPRVGVSEDFK
jgi:hypothetical protein